MDVFSRHGNATVAHLCLTLHQLRLCRQDLVSVPSFMSNLSRMCRYRYTVQHPFGQHGLENIPAVQEWLHLHVLGRSAAELQQLQVQAEAEAAAQVGPASPNHESIL